MLAIEIIGVPLCWIVLGIATTALWIRFGPNDDVIEGERAMMVLTIGFWPLFALVLLVYRSALLLGWTCVRIGDLCVFLGNLGR